MNMKKCTKNIQSIAPIVFVLLQIFLLSVYSEMNTELFDLNNFGTYYLIFLILLTFIFYLLTTYKDPGFVTLQEYQYTDASNPYAKKKYSFHVFPGNSHIKTAQLHQDEQVELQVQVLSKTQSPKPDKKKKNQFELECEQSVDEHQSPEYDINQAESFAKTPEKSKTHSKNQSCTQSPNDIKTSTQIISQGSTKEETAQTQQKHSTSVVVQAHKNLNESYYQSPSNIDKNVDCSDQGNSIFIEKRYCPICNQDQMIRSKHCSRCKKCVAQYDHHCPWASNCIGEKNKCVYYWFLVFQTQEMLYVILASFQHINFNRFSIPVDIILLIAILVSIALTLMVLSLFLFHTLLSFQNLTTWEYKSWKRISYLKDFPQQMGSPFSRGWKENLKQFCRISVPKLTLWEYNTQIVNVIK